MTITPQCACFSHIGTCCQEPPSPTCLTAEHHDLVPDTLARARTEGTARRKSSGIYPRTHSVPVPDTKPMGAWVLADRFLHKRSREIKPVSANLDAFFECFAAHHAIVDPLTGRFNLSRKEHAEVVHILKYMLEKHGKDGLLPLSEFESTSLAQRWAFMSKGVLSVTTCNRIIQLVRVSAFGQYVDVNEFIQTVLLVENRRLRVFYNFAAKFAIVLAYYVFGVLFYYYYEQWSLMNSVYFITISVSTIGYGDLVCGDDGCRLFTVFYIGLGIVLVVGVITSSVTSVLDGYQDRVKEVGRTIMESSNRWKRRRKIASLYTLHIVYALLLLAIPLLVGSVLFYLLAREEIDVTVTMALYWALQTCATIGYGDLTLDTPWTKFWICLFVFLAIGCVSAAIAQIGSLRLTMNAYKRQELLQNKRLAVSLISQLDVGATGVDKFEFLAAMLVALEKVKPEEVSDILHQFDELDIEKRGVLNLERLASLRQSHKLARLVSGIPSGSGRLTSDDTLEGLSRYVAPFASSRVATPIVPEDPSVSTHTI